MLKLDLLNEEGKKVKELELNDNVFGVKPNDAVIYDAVVLAAASVRQGTAKAKNRSEVSGGGRKPYKQKGTGNARQGSIRSPQFRGGGVVFGPQPRSYDKRQNKKERRLALKSALSYKVMDKELIIVDKFIDSPKTKDMIGFLKGLGATKSALIVTHDLTENMILSSRNLDTMKVIKVDEVNTYDVLNYQYLVLTKEAVKMLEEVLA